ncbi:unnamed protein product, partial [Strongylus vulgaris]
MTSYRDTLDAIDSARDHAPCGPCQHDAGRGDIGSRKTAKSVDAFVRLTSAQLQQQQQQQEQRRAQQQQEEARRYEEYRRTISRPTFSVPADQNRQWPQQSYDRQKQYPQMQTQQQQQQSRERVQYYQPTTTTTSFPYWERRDNIVHPQTGNYRTPGDVRQRQDEQ